MSEISDVAIHFEVQEGHHLTREVFPKKF